MNTIEIAELRLTLNQAGKTQWGVQSRPYGYSIHRPDRSMAFQVERISLNALKPIAEPGKPAATLPQYWATYGEILTGTAIGLTPAAAVQSALDSGLCAISAIQQTQPGNTTESNVTTPSSRPPKHETVDTAQP